MNISIIQALILGVIQGLTEFLPLSSSGHLAIIQNMMGVNESMLSLAIFLHLGTLMAVIIFFRRHILELTKKKIVWLLVVSIPVFIAGLLFHQQIDAMFSSLLTVGIMLIITGLMNLFNNKSSKKTLQNSNSASNQALFVGLLQALAILPGVSRSGSVLFAHRVLKIDNKKTFVNTFLLSIPVIIASVLFELYKNMNLISEISFSLPILIGIASSFIVGLISLKILHKLVVQNKLYIFGYYCLALGSIIVIFHY